MGGPKKRSSFYFIGLVLCLCSLSYLLGVWEHGSTASGGLPSDGTRQLPPSQCSIPANASKLGLHFGANHNAQYDSAGVAEKTMYPFCDHRYSEYTPCEDPKRSLKFDRNRLIYRERHCPKKSEILKCRVPATDGYKPPFRWPESRDVVWFANVPHRHLTVEKAEQNWIRFDGDRFRFPGGGTMFPKGADAYIHDISKLINFQDGSIRTAIDTGCGVASWGGYLLSRNIITMSFAPRDTHEAQVQFALERGVPALIGVMASKRLPYPARAFDMAHCSRCLIPWSEHEGIYLMEVDRVLRPGGYWILSGPPINWRKHSRGWQRTKQDLNSEQTRIDRVARSLCWKKLVEKDDIVIWQKPIKHVDCDFNRSRSRLPSLCPSDDPDRAWYTEMEPCLTRLPDFHRELEKWPGRLKAVPPRILAGSTAGISGESFRQDSELWKRRVSYYKTVNNQLRVVGRYRNLLDMNAGLGGFAAGLVDDPVWVMNVVPVEAGVNTLGVIYERGLIGTYQSWCEAMSTYPRTYDLLHANALFTMYKDRCEMEDVLLEMDRILRPEGSVIFRDDVDVLVKMKKIIDRLSWDSQIVDHEDGPTVREKLMFAVKSHWLPAIMAPS